MFRAQRNYARKRAIVDTIFMCFEDSGEVVRISDLHKKYGVPERTLRRWRQLSKSDRDWRPYHTENRGSHHRIFTDAEENSITEFIVENYFQPGWVFHDEDFKFIAMQAYLEKHGDDAEFKNFQCSKGFIWDFKKRNKLSSRRAHYKRRPATKYDPEKWVAEVKQILETVPHDRVLNADETAWRILPNGATTWAQTGSDNVTLTIRDDEKQTVTVMATVSASGSKFPLMMICKGGPIAERNQLQDIHPHLPFHTEKGWMNRESFETYLKFIRQQFSDDDPIYLLLDTYTVHKLACVRELAAGLNIHLRFIPAGMTDKYQPLDRRVFGALKSTAKRYIYREMATNPTARIGMPKAIAILIRCWESLSPAVINSAWSLYLEDVQSDEENPSTDNDQL